MPFLLSLLHLAGAVTLLPKEIKSFLVTVAYPMLTRGGELLESRLARTG